MDMKKDSNNIFDLIDLVPYFDANLNDLVKYEKLVDNEDFLMAKWVSKFGRERYVVFYENSKEYFDCVYRLKDEKLKYKFIDSQFHNYEVMMDYFKIN